MAAAQKLLSIIIVLGVIIFAINMCSKLIEGHDNKDRVEVFAYNYINDVALKDKISPDQNRIVEIEKINKGKIGWSVEGKVTIYGHKGEESIHKFWTCIQYDKKRKEHYVETGLIEGLN